MPFSLYSSAADTLLNAVGLSEKTVSPYMQKSKQIIQKMMTTPFLQGWQWMIEIESGPTEFDIFVKDIDFGAGSIDYETFQIGNGAYSIPTFSDCSEVVMTVRDTPDLVVAKWFDEQLAKVKNKDGTFNLPGTYVFTITVFILDDNLNKTELAKMQVSASKKGNYTLSREGVNEFISYPLTFQKFSTIGTKKL